MDLTNVRNVVRVEEDCRMFGFLWRCFEGFFRVGFICGVLGWLRRVGRGVGVWGCLWGFGLVFGLLSVVMISFYIAYINIQHLNHNQNDLHLTPINTTNTIKIKIKIKDPHKKSQLIIPNKSMPYTSSLNTF